MESESQRMSRKVNHGPESTTEPTPAQIRPCPILLYHDEYAAQRGGPMDFWDELTEAQKRNCRERMREIELAPEEF